MLIGLGLGLKDISYRAAEDLEEAEKIYLEDYTTPIDKEYKAFLSEKAKKPITQISRPSLEEKIKETLKEAEHKKIAILAAGDPLIATTHHIILDEAAKKGIKVKVYHAQSIFTAAIGESGLDIYRFGPTTTIPFWSEKYKPTSFIETIKNNLKNKEHTLVLVDISHENKMTMGMDEALRLLILADKDKNTLNEGTKILVLGNIGHEDQSIIYSRISDTHKDQVKDKMLNKRICMIIPAEPNFAEEEALKRLSA